MSLPATPWDLADIWYATSLDGHHWEEQGPAVQRGRAGAYDERSVFTPGVLAHSGRYYLVYQVAPSPNYRCTPESIAIAWSDSPDGPWTKSPAPIVEPDESGEIDEQGIPEASRRSRAPGIVCKFTIPRCYTATDNSGSITRAKASAITTWNQSGASPSPIRRWVPTPSRPSIRSPIAATKSWFGSTRAAWPAWSTAAGRRKTRFNSRPMASTLKSCHTSSSRPRAPDPCA